MKKKILLLLTGLVSIAVAIPIYQWYYRQVPSIMKKSGIGKFLEDMDKWKPGGVDLMFFILFILVIGGIGVSVLGLFILHVPKDKNKKG